MRSKSVAESQLAQRPCSTAACAPVCSPNCPHSRHCSRKWPSNQTSHASCTCTKSRLPTVYAEGSPQHQFPRLWMLLEVLPSLLLKIHGKQHQITGLCPDPSDSVRTGRPATTDYPCRSLLRSCRKNKVDAFEIGLFPCNTPTQGSFQHKISNGHIRTQPSYRNENQCLVPLTRLELEQYCSMPSPERAELRMVCTSMRWPEVSILETRALYNGGHRTHNPITLDRSSRSITKFHIIEIVNFNTSNPELSR